MDRKMKVVWVCHFSNPEVREHLTLSYPWYERMARYLMHKKPTLGWLDYAIWNTNGIKEFKKFEDVELHVVSPASHISSNKQEFISDGIYYHFFKSDQETFSGRVMSIIKKGPRLKYNKSSKIINSYIKQISPDIIHIIGPENRDYSTFVFDCPKSIPVISQLDTLICEPSFLLGYPESTWPNWRKAAEVEKKVLKRSDYIGTEAIRFVQFLRKEVIPQGVFFDIDLATGFNYDDRSDGKEFDFVYFANSISKSLDLAIEAFAIAKKSFPGITLDVIGGCPSDYKQMIDDRIQKLGIADAITFEGRYNTHDEVIEQIRRSRFALLPFKVDYNPTTIPESMSCGLPVVSTMTGGTEKLYVNEDEVLLSPIGDHEAMARNMIRLISSDTLQLKLRDNGRRKIENDFNNTLRMKKWVEVYKSVLDHRNQGSPFPDKLLHHDR
jgi:glycosyltransferase involved in cell wall biosynthesis